MAPSSISNVTKGQLLHLSEHPATIVIKPADSESRPPGHIWALTLESDFLGSNLGTNLYLTFLSQCLYL